MVILEMQILVPGYTLANTWQYIEYLFHCEVLVKQEGITLDSRVILFVYYFLAN